MPFPITVPARNRAAKVHGYGIKTNLFASSVALLFILPPEMPFCQTGAVWK